MQASHKHTTAYADAHMGSPTTSSRFSVGDHLRNPGYVAATAARSMQPRRSLMFVEKLARTSASPISSTIDDKALPISSTVIGSTVAVAPGTINVVASICSIIAGPSIRLPAASLSRS